MKKILSILLFVVASMLVFGSNDSIPPKASSQSDSVQAITNSIALDFQTENAHSDTIRIIEGSDHFSGFQIRGDKLTYPIPFFIIGLYAILITVWLIIEKLKFRDNVLYVLTGKRGNKSKGKSRIDVFKAEISKQAINDFMTETLTNGKQGLTKTEVEAIVNNRLKEWEIEFIGRQQEIGEKESQSGYNDVSKRDEFINETKTLYANSIIKGVFNRVTEQPIAGETNFELQLESSNSCTAKVTLHPGAYGRLVRSHLFLDGCKVSRLNKDYTTIETEQPGEAVLGQDGKWKIEVPLKLLLK